MSFLSGIFKTQAAPVLPLPAVNATPKSAPPALVQPAGKTRVLGVDVYHGDPLIDWVKAKATGCQWMYAKASEHGIDSLLQKHTDSAKAAGVLTAAYHFFHANVDGKAQADLYLKATSGLRFNLPAILDWEQGSIDGQSREKQILEAQKWLDAVEAATGRVPWIYMGAALAASLKLPDIFGRYRLIVAHYGIMQNQLKCPTPWASLTGWQFSDAFSMPGVAVGHHIDANYFLGTYNDLLALSVPA